VVKAFKFPDYPISGTTLVPLLIPVTQHHSSHNILRVDLLPNSQCPIVGILETQEILVRAVLVRVMPLGQKQERPPRGHGVFICRVAT